MRTRSSKRQRLTEESPIKRPKPATFDADAYEYLAASDEERRSWGGWCEIESEPAFFNVMLKSLGVKGVKVQEIVSLDDEILLALPRPYGLIFLFMWRELDSATTEFQQAPPDNIWFANQTFHNGCATIALLNIINNVTTIDLGEHLSQFKEFVRDFPPHLRGEALCNFEFTREVHNSFAKKMDMLTGDLELKSRATRAQTGRTTKDHKAESAYHFNAFLPSDDDGMLWKLDGLDVQPRCLGDIGETNWLLAAKKDLEARMAVVEDERVEFAALAVVEDPLLQLRKRLAGNVKGLQNLKTCFEKSGLEWQKTEPVQNRVGLCDPSEYTKGTTTVMGPEGSLGLLQEHIDIADASWSPELSTSSNDLYALKAQTEEAQEELRFMIRAEEVSNNLDDDKAAERRHDYGPAIQAWLRYHCRRSAIKDILDSLADASE